MLYLKCQGQVTSIDVDERIADKHINANTVHWEFCERWDGMVITAQFTQSGKTYDVLVDEVTKTTTLPNELVAGEVDISAFGEHPVSGVRITTIPVKKKIDKSGFVGDGETPIPPTPDLYAQLLEKVNKTAIPHIGANGNWWFDDWDSGVAATAEVDAARQAAVNEINRAAANQMLEIDNKFQNTMKDIPETYTELDADVKSLKDTKADAIRDTSAKAVAHELHAQSGPMSVTLYGKTVETGTGEKSPENPYTISGVSKAEVQAGNKNLYGGMYLAEDIAEKVPGAVIDTTAKTVKYSATGISGVRIFDRFKPNTRYTIVLTSSERSTANRPNLAVYYTDTSSPSVLVFAENAGTKRQLVYHTLAGKSVKALIGYNNSGVQFLLYEECGIFEGVLTAEDFEPYNANVIGMPLLPDGDPLMEGDTVENDVASGCDVAITFNSSSGWKARNSDVANSFSYTLPIRADLSHRDVFRSNRMHRTFVSGIANSEYDMISVYGTSETGKTDTIYLRLTGLTTLADLDTYLAANPLTIYYRSSEYTPGKDIRVCRVTRKSTAVMLDGSIIPDTETVLGNCIRCSIKTGISNSDAAVGVCGEVPYKFDYASDTEHVYIGPNTYAYVFIQTNRLSTANKAGVMEYLQNNPITAYIMQATTEIYYTDHHDLRKPYGIMPVTVTGSGETAVEYPHDTKHYIDSQIAAAVALALNG